MFNFLKHLLLLHHVIVNLGYNNSIFTLIMILYASYVCVCAVLLCMLRMCVCAFLLCRESLD
jgi:hypothetical protein